MDLSLYNSSWKYSLKPDKVEDRAIPRLMKYSLKYIIYLGMAYDDKESTVSSLMEEVCLYLHILALKKMLCPLFSPIQLQPAANPASRTDLNPVWKGAAATICTHDTLPQ